ncbi:MULTISPECIES: excinuclease ABC subunit UvrC [Fusobacterium]|uniref:excinuclease ABC subunit UvrC n=1 Tax=Fusobacterium TaxID=848 RepID=UPI000E55387B|nr:MULTISPECIES: excinuclease ABC subunit UvrC [Fusobacterium]MCF2627040.1 excinuclease ABC subunit UvrC [Fusobacterium mortiferum]MDY4802259.1 excinuclease ABC subunit UvrC [Fusobacterium mortiferum]MSS61041.1 excinuclease ABC subunit UvrC [Fusobacterium sp. FSA-380-WT-2B]RHF67373.1 excinuclease ABC subunit UvrC [Fusobacterium mortiferum]
MVEIFDIKKLDIPENPGVYLMKKNSKVIYVGKAKNLKNRVSSYFNREHESEKTRELVKNIEDIEFIICNSELDALVLENNLIKKYTPKYNILLKDEKTYPYIRISKENFPNIKIIRTTKALDTKSGLYFGPYPFGAWNLKKALVKIFKIRDCERDMNKIYPRPCLKYFMKMCPGPCTYKDIFLEYNGQVERVKNLLKGKEKEVIASLKKDMEKAAEDMRFEEAINLREQIKEVESAVVNQVTEYGKELDEDIFLMQKEGEKVFICVLNVRDGKILGKISTHIDLKDKIEGNLEENIVTAFYSKHPIPKSIVFQEKMEDKLNLVREILELQRGKKVEFHFPKIKSRRKELLEMGELNISRDIESYFKKKSVVEEGLYKIYTELSLKRYPRKIECFDISNIQGKDAVASMSVSVEGRASKKDYRKFKITCKDTPDDFAMMREVITRRYSKLPEHEFPDIVLIDGGLGQINAAGEVFKEIGKDGIAELLSLAKRDEEIYKYGESVPYSFPKEWEALKIFQRVRDEAHRFGITYHRKLRSKRVISSELDKVEGVGTKRREVLLKEFGSVKKILEEDIDSLARFVPRKVAENILDTLKNNKDT